MEALDEQDSQEIERLLGRVNTLIYEKDLLTAEVERLREELVWCHEGLTRAHETINPGVPAPDWATVYASLEDTKEGVSDAE